MNAFLTKCKNALKWRLKRLLNKNKDPDAQFNAVLSHFLKQQDQITIFDIGAHRGESTARFRKLFPTAAIHAFEPDQENFEALTARWGAQSGICLNNLGVSATKGHLTFYKNRKSSTSGFHAVDPNSKWARDKSARHNVNPEEYTEKSYDVPVTDLDSYIEENKIEHIHLLKMDTQGHEDEVLKGCSKAIQSGMIDVIESELITGSAYVKSLNFYDLEKILLPHGYCFFGIDTSGDKLHNPSLSFNVIYIHKKLLS